MSYTIKPGALYIGDNGRTLCGNHLGAKARGTGIDLDGLGIVEITPAVVRESVALYGDASFKCEHPGCTVKVGEPNKNHRRSRR